MFPTQPIRWQLLLFIIIAWHAGSPIAADSQDRPVSRILFGSCAKQDRPMPIFETIVAQEPDLFVFLGDNIYADTVNMDVMRSKYAKLNANAGFAKLMEPCPVLGEAQWKWLEQQLRQPAEVHIFASSIQCVSESAGQETWSNLPHERQRLFDLITETKASGVLIISGDRHWAELSVDEDAAPYPIYDLTSSSFNQIHPRGTPTDNKYRAEPATYHRENFGAITIDWKQDDPQVTLQVRDIDAQVQLEKTIRLSQLRAPPHDRELKNQQARKALGRKVRPVIDELDRLCRKKNIYMLGPTKAKRLAELIRVNKPEIVVECGTALGYSGLWIARELKAAGSGKLITVEIDEERANRAKENFEKAGLADVVEM